MLTDLFLNIVMHLVFLLHIAMLFRVLFLLQFFFFNYRVIWSQELDNLKMLFKGDRACCYRPRIFRLLCFENWHIRQLVWGFGVAFHLPFDVTGGWSILMWAPMHTFKTRELLNYWQFPLIRYSHPKMQRVISVMLEKNQTRG